MGCIKIGGVYNLILDARRTAYDPFGTIYDLGTAKSITVTPDEVYTSIRAGYADQTYEQPSGRFEFNSEQIWRVPFENVTDSELDLSVPCRTDSFGILQTYLKYADTYVLTPDKDGEWVKADKTQDEPSDNEIFLIDCEPDGDDTIPSRSKFTSVTTDEFPEYAFNVFLTPKRNLIRQGAFIRSMLERYPARFMVLTSAKKSTNVSSRLDTESAPVVESVKISMFELDEALFLPVSVDVVIAQPNDIFNALGTLKEYGILKFKYKNSYFYGYLQTISPAMFDRKEINVSLKLANIPQNDLTKLII
jgi:hypothetical protein